MRIFDWLRQKNKEVSELIDSMDRNEDCALSDTSRLYVIGQCRNCKWWRPGDEKNYNACGYMHPTVIDPGPSYGCIYWWGSDATRTKKGG